MSANPSSAGEQTDAATATTGEEQRPPFISPFSDDTAAPACDTPMRAPVRGGGGGGHVDNQGKADAEGEEEENAEEERSTEKAYSTPTRSPTARSFSQADDECSSSGHGGGGGDNGDRGLLNDPEPRGDVTVGRPPRLLAARSQRTALKQQQQQEKRASGPHSHSHHHSHAPLDDDSSSSSSTSSVGAAVVGAEAPVALGPRALPPAHTAAAAASAPHSTAAASSAIRAAANTAAPSSASAATGTSAATTPASVTTTAAAAASDNSDSGSTAAATATAASAPASVARGGAHKPQGPAPLRLPRSVSLAAYNADIDSDHSGGGYGYGGFPPSAPPVALEQYGCCVFFFPTKVISWVLPFMGHVAISNADGTRLFTFESSYYVREEWLADVLKGVVPAARRVQLPPALAATSAGAGAAAAGGRDRSPLPTTSADTDTSDGSGSARRGGAGSLRGRRSARPLRTAKTQSSGSFLSSLVCGGTSAAGGGGGGASPSSASAPGGGGGSPSSPAPPSSGLMGLSSPLLAACESPAVRRRGKVRAGHADVASVLVWDLKPQLMESRGRQGAYAGVPNGARYASKFRPSAAREGSARQRPRAGGESSASPSPSAPPALERVGADGGEASADSAEHPSSAETQQDSNDKNPSSSSNNNNNNNNNNHLHLHNDSGSVASDHSNKDGSDDTAASSSYHSDGSNGVSNEEEEALGGWGHGDAYGGDAPHHHQHNSGGGGSVFGYSFGFGGGGGLGAALGGGGGGGHCGNGGGDGGGGGGGGPHRRLNAETRAFFDAKLAETVQLFRGAGGGGAAQTSLEPHSSFSFVGFVLESCGLEWNVARRWQQESQAARAAAAAAAKNSGNNDSAGGSANSTSSGNTGSSASAGGGSGPRSRSDAAGMVPENTSEWGWLPLLVSLFLGGRWLYSERRLWRLLHGGNLLVALVLNSIILYALWLLAPPLLLSAVARVWAVLGGGAAEASADAAAEAVVAADAAANAANAAAASTAAVAELL